MESLPPQIKGGTTLVESFPGSLCTKLIEELDYLQSSFDALSFGMINDIVTVLHETTIAVSVITFYIDLLHLDSLSLPPQESNMFLNFCTMSLFQYKISLDGGVDF